MMARSDQKGSRVAMKLDMELDMDCWFVCVCVGMYGCCCMRVNT